MKDQKNTVTNPQSRSKNQSGSTLKRSALGVHLLLPLIAISGLSMGNKGCEETSKTRALKMDVEIGTLKGRVIRLPNGETIDFPYVANALFYREVIKHDHFLIANPLPTSLSMVAGGGAFKMSSGKNSDSSENSEDEIGLVSRKDVSVLDQYRFLDKVRAQGQAIFEGRVSMNDAVEGKFSASGAASLPACLYEMPQALLGGEVLSFEATWGVGLGIGYNPNGELPGSAGGKVNFSQSKFEIGLRTENPLSRQVIAIGDGVSRQSKVNVGLDFASGLPIGLNFFFNTPITDVIRNGMKDGLDQIVDTYIERRSPNKDWNEVWESRVVYDPELVNGDTHVAFRAGELAGIKVGDTFKISNMRYEWEGAPCTTRLKYSIVRTTTPIATAEVVSVGDNVSVAKVTYLTDTTNADLRIQPGAQVKVFKLAEPVVKKQ